jgi:hypothetical protein
VPIFEGCNLKLFHMKAVATDPAAEYQRRMSLIVAQGGTVSP